jgi:hypothetical protein
VAGGFFYTGLGFLQSAFERVELLVERGL